ncbi:NADPH-dependent FMN reductase [Micromonospora sp. NPDC051227]|uniref:NADPH-dependent FMN reductase n=1 Tax=Micromonospora sp. NPDC051227 TaxID=3364285 RepID=UPI001932DB8A|nr:NAD(P)H-dependent oxidoreductase [Micromonospora sp. STR1s_5]
MSSSRLRLAIVVGSIRAGRFGSVAARWLAGQAELRDDLQVDLIELAEARLPEVRLAEGDVIPQAVCDLSPWLAGADAFVVVVPEHNRSFPASLKNAVDWYREEWQAKPVGFLCYGGPAGGLRAAEQLRQVFAALGAATIRETISLSHHRALFDARGRPVDAESVSVDARRMFDELVWWAEALRNHRQLRPYVR